ncbi:unnamed protein product [Caenorhabditis auriculariae]|uniref:Uncharacterized protein n=1 Tax=Caenorhabditis auriculariae TaxID=2777116 RepID=A0A8S1H1F2_9PELO|nr:unnamed protein product [Caenorhabditis auriculariae]
MKLLLVLLQAFSVVVVVQGGRGRASRQGEANSGSTDDYTDFETKTEETTETKTGGANHDLKQVSYTTIAPKVEMPIDEENTGEKETFPATKEERPSPVPATTAKPKFVYRRGYYFQHYPWDRLPRRYLLRPAMTFVYPPKHQFVTYSYPYLPYSDPYNIYRSHPGIGGGCGGGGGCGYSGYGGYAQQGCGGGDGCGNGGDYAASNEGSEEDDEESGRSGEAHINKKDPLEDLDLEDLERIDKEDSEEEEKEVKTTKITKMTKKTKEEEIEDLDLEEKLRRLRTRLLRLHA